jgi:hypothetical protein
VNPHEYSRLRGVFLERVHDYELDIARRGLAGAREALLAEMVELVREDPATAARLLAGAVDLAAE